MTKETNYSVKHSQQEGFRLKASTAINRKMVLTVLENNYIQNLTLIFMLIFSVFLNTDESPVNIKTAKLL